jgi:hypothetical protein
MLSGNNCQKLAFVRDMQWIEAKKFASATHGIAYGDFLFEENNAVTAVSRQFTK